MLEPNSRRLLMESLQPPDGYRLDWTVGTTYTLDLMALLTAPVAFAFSDWQDRDGRPTCDPLALLKAVRQYANRVCIFCQAGKIHVPKTYQPLLSSLEESVIEATAPKGGSFHPKMWFLRFIDKEDGSVFYRVLCLSRNMTFDRSWDTLLCLEGPLRDRANAFSRNHPLGQFVEALPGMSTRRVPPTWKKRIAILAHEIRRVEFETPEPFEDFDFCPLGLEGNHEGPFPYESDRMLIISPFVSDGMIDEWLQWNIPVELLSRPEQICRISEDNLEQIENVWILDDTANPEPGEMEQEDEQVATDLNEEHNSDDIPLVGLHAKVYVVNQGWTATVLTGSANATQAAFYRNVEFLVALRGKKSRCGIDAILGEKSDNDAKRASGLADLLQPYIPSNSETEFDEDVADFERSVDTLSRQLSQSSPETNCETGASPGTFRIEISPTKKRKLLIDDDWVVRIRPISLRDSQFSPMDFGSPIWVEFESISILGLTSFFVIEVESVSLKSTRRFVLNIPLVGTPENRHEAILRELLSDRERVMRFLLLLLLDTGARDLSKFFGMAGEGEGESDGQSGYFFSLFGATLFESLMKALDHDPERLEQVASVIMDLQKTEEGRDLIPEDFSDVWNPIWAVRTQQIESQLKTKGGN